MSTSLQKTIKNSIHIEGVGLHNGLKVNITLIPAEANTGIIFKRTDVDSEKSIIEASYKNVSAPVLCTKIKNSHGVEVSTIEHLMAAFYGEGIDNVLIEVKDDFKFESVIERAKKSVILLSMNPNVDPETDPSQTGLCSGVVIDEVGHILTNFHCVYN